MAAGTRIGDAIIRIIGDSSKFAPDLQKAVKKAQAKVSSSLKDLGKRMDADIASGWKQFPSLGATLTALLPVITSGLSALLGATTALAGALVQASGAALAFAPGLASLGQAAIVGIIAFKGFGSAVADGGEALDKLAPSARASAEAIRSLQPIYQSLQQSLQQRVFAGLAADLTRVGPLIRGITPALNSTATALNGTLASLLKWATATSTVRTLNDVLQRQAVIFGTLGQAAAPALNGLLQIFQGLSPSGQRLADIILNLSNRFNAWATRINESGALADFMDRAFRSAGLLLSVLGNLGGVLGNVLGASSAAGDSLLGTLDGALAKLREVTGSVSGQNAIATWAQGGVDAMTKLFEVGGQIGSALGPILGSLFDPGLFSSILGVISSLTPAISAIAGVIQNVIGSILESAGPALAEFAPKIAKLFTALSPLLEGVGAVIGQIISQALGMLGTVIDVITPIVAVISNVLGPVLKKFAPIIAFLILSFTTWGARLVTLIPIIGRFLAPLVKLAQFLIQGLAKAFSVILKVAGPVFTFMSGIIRTHISIWMAIFRAVGKVISVVFNAIRAVVARVVGWLAPYVTGHFRLVQKIVTVVWGVVRKVTVTTFNAFRAAISKVLGWARSYITTVFGIYRKVIVTVWNAVRSATVAVWNAVRAAVSKAVSTVRSLVTSGFNRVRSIVTSVWNAVRSATVAAWNAIVNAIRGAAGRVFSAAKSVVSRVKSAFSGMASLLTSAGRDIISGLLAGMTGMAGEVYAKAREIAGNITSTIKGALGISSPSKVMKGVGRDVNRGLAKGLEQRKELNKNIKKITDSLTKLISKGSVKSLRSGLTAIRKSIRSTFEGKMETRALKVLDRYGPAIRRTTARIGELQKRSDAVTKSLASWKQRLADARAAYHEYAASIKTEVVGNFNPLAGIFEEGVDGPIINRIKNLSSAAYSQATGFISSINELRKKGASEALISQVMGLGFEQGKQVADALVADKSGTIKSINDQFSKISSQAGTLGKNLAEQFYRAGIDAAAGMVKGLTSQQKALDKSMDRLADRLVDRIKKKLKIKSPSQVLAGLGEDTVAGMAQGLSRTKPVEAASDRVALAAIPKPVQPNALDVATAATRAASIAANGAANMGNLAQMFAGFMGRLKLEVTLGADRRSKAVWYLDGKKYAETLA
jgi:phage-related protein